MKVRGINRVNYWKQQVSYARRSSAQSFLSDGKSSNLKKTMMTGSDCSCNCYGGCSCTSD